jgi:hypothetical protein
VDGRTAEPSGSIGDISSAAMMDLNLSSVHYTINSNQNDMTTKVLNQTVMTIQHQLDL